jgi:hypothetical protein
MPYRRESTAVLATWRKVERQMLVAPLDSPEFERLKEEWARLRVEYGRLIDIVADHEMLAPRTLPLGASDGGPKRELAERSGELLDELEHLKDTEDLKRREPISTGPSTNWRMRSPHRSNASPSWARSQRHSATRLRRAPRPSRMSIARSQRDLDLSGGAGRWLAREGIGWISTRRGDRPRTDDTGAASCPTTKSDGTSAPTMPRL